MRRCFNPEATEEEIAALVASMPTWCCPECGEEMAARHAPGPGEDPRCWKCSNPKPRIQGRSDRLEAVGCPRRFAREPFQQRAQPRDARHPGFAAGEWRGEPWAIGFAGKTNAGKTFLATELFYRCLERYRSAAWRRADELAESYLGFRGAPAREEALRAVEADLLLIDDLGRGLEIAGRVGGLNEIVSVRHADLRATIWTTNLRSDQVVALDGGMGRRLVQDGIVLSVLGEFKPIVPRQMQTERTPGEDDDQ